MVEIPNSSIGLAHYENIKWLNLFIEIKSEQQSKNSIVRNDQIIYNFSGVFCIELLILYAYFGSEVFFKQLPFGRNHFSTHVRRNNKINVDFGNRKVKSMEIFMNS